MREAASYGPSSMSWWVMTTTSERGVQDELIFLALERPALGDRGSLGQAAKR